MKQNHNNVFMHFTFQITSLKLCQIPEQKFKHLKRNKQTLYHMTLMINLL